MEKRASSAFTLALLGILLAGGLAVASLGALALARSRAQYLARAEADAQNLCLVLAQNLADTFAQIDHALLSVKDEAERQLAAGPVDGPRLEASIERTRGRLPALEGLRTVDARGRVDHGTGIGRTSCINVSDRDFFLRLREGADPGLVISKPVLGRITGKWVIVLARRLNRPDGSFGGVVQGAITLDYLTRQFASLDLGQEGSISFRDPELTVIARHPGPKGPGSFTGVTAASPEFLDLQRAGRTTGTFTAASVLDGVTKVFAFVRLPGYRQTILVGLGKREALAGWRREAALTAASVGALLALILACSGLVHHAWRKQREAARALAEQESKYRSIFENAFEGIFQAELDGPILSLNPAFARVWGYSAPEEMLAEIRSLDQLGWVRAEDRERLRRALLEAGRIADLEVEFRRKDGTPVWVLANAHLIPGPEGEARIYEGMTADITERKKAEAERERLIQELQRALADVKALSGLLPICSKCKKIRDDHGYWNQIEAYITSHSEANFTHGICPECARELFPELYSKRDTRPE